MRHRILVFCGWCCLTAATWGQTASAPASNPAGILAVPEAALQDKSREMIRKLFAKEFAKTAPAERVALAKVLLAQARDTQDDPVARYVALHDSVDLAAGAGDAATAMAALAEMVRGYRVEALELRRAALVKAGAAASAEADCLAVMRLALEVADEAAAADAFEGVLQLASVAESAANKSGQLKAAAGIQGRLTDLRALATEYGQVKAARAQLERTPADAAAHLTLGRFYALHKGQWALGLPHLAQGGDAELAALAARELAQPAEGFLQTQIGDDWWDYAEKSTGLTRAVVSAHATEWYKTAQQTIKGITLARIQARIDQAATRVATTMAAGVELLPLIDPAKDAAQGQWSRGAEGLTCANSAYACLRVPYMPTEEYDLTATFTRTEDNGAVALLLAAQKRAFGFVLDIKGEARFELVGGNVAKDNPTVMPVAVSNNRRYTLTVEVRRDRVRALLDGKALCEWKTDFKDLSRYSVWKLGDNALCGIGVNGAKVTFHSVEMREVTGKGKPVR